MKRTKKYAAAMMMCFLIVAMLPLSAMAAKSKGIPNDNKGIPDPVLYQAILTKLGKEADETFTKKEAESIKSLVCTNDGKETKVKTLKGLGKLKNLKRLNVSDNRLSSLKGIEGLTKLTHLAANYNQITRIDPLKKLVKLKSFHAYGNKITSLKSLENLTRLDSLDVQINRIKELPDLNKYPHLQEIEVKYNLISEKELDRKLPENMGRDNAWYKSTVELQNLKYTIKLTQPNSFDEIDKDTKKIVGKASKKASIVLRDSFGKRIQAVKSDAKGRFTLKNLDLTQWAGQALSLESFVTDKLYNERYMLKKVNFTIPN